MNLITTVLAFLLALGPLIIFHELGHYFAARLCGVKVLRFSVGMGKVVWSRRFGRDQTEWAISVLPLGGYVKMLDSRDPDAPSLTPEDEQREFTRQNVWRRIAIVAAGPFANFILAIVLFAGLFMYGIAEPTTRIRPMPETTAAWQAGLRGGDQVTAVNGKAVAGWSDLNWEIVSSAIDKRDVRLEVERQSVGSLDLVLPASSFEGMDADADLLGAVGIMVARPLPVLGKIMPGGAAERAGLQSGDLVTSVDGKPTSDGIVFIEAVRAAGQRTLDVKVMRGGREVSVKVTPERDAATGHGRIKAEVALAPDMVKVASGPLDSVSKAMRKTWETSALTVKMIGKMITGEVSLKNVTGPITIADYAGQTARIGAVSFLIFVASISISLGVMNLLPIPVLDGGLLLYYSLEVLTGRPLPERIGAYAQRLGVAMLVMLMVLAVFNDVARLL
ncbi:RIP metalloprotease RseP [Massilia cavernae]|uniref:Zinc metalloprotease n=1 Tax=Massilia cavernae TaxID=2320864 RepID=A0A418Y589_9BURK|nr:RIP metalloprotease RseP [Massilia cavernae]RJG21594.1 RIP metalloprotease RseP [Massilia cavernae]